MTQSLNLLQGPEPVETAELHFKLYCKLKIFETETKYEGGHCCILAVSQYYGLIFVGNCKGFSVIQTKALTPTIDLESFPRKDIILDLRPTHISVDFSQKILAVVCSSKSGSVLTFYNIQSLVNKDVTPLKVTWISKLIQNSTAEVVDLTWQPVPDGSLMFCLSDGSVLALSQGAKDGPLFTLPITTQATCFCWSPKGKQIVVGSASGTLSQYKPDLKVVKTLPPPALFNGAVMVVSVLWISSFQFAVAYNDRANPESFPVITVVNAAKNEPINVINYDDITYSSTLFRNHQIYMTHQSAWVSNQPNDIPSPSSSWLYFVGVSEKYSASYRQGYRSWEGDSSSKENLIFVSSANSIEVAVLHSKDGSSWEQWLLGDASRAELPLNPDRQETFPLGWGFDYTSQETISWGEGTLPPMPRLLLVSDEGLLCVFNVVNTVENAPQLCAPPKEILGDSFFIAGTKTAAPPVSEPPKPAFDGKSLLGTPVFGNSKPTYTFESTPTFGGFGISKPQTAAPQITAQIPQQHPEPVIQIQQQIQQPQTQIQKQQSQPAVQIHQQQSQPTVQIHQQQSQPTVQIHQQQSQPTVQIHQQLQPQISFAQSTTNFKLSTPSFGIPSTFSFGSSPSVLVSKSATLGNENVTKTTSSEAISMTIKPPTGQGDIFAGKNLLQSTPIKHSEASDDKTVKKPEETVETVGKTEDGQGDSPGPRTPELATVDDSVYLNAMQEEIDHFNSELQQLSAKAGKINIHVGFDESKAKVKKSIDGLFDFWKELKETTEGQSGEIHAVVMDLMEAFAWLEDAKSSLLLRKNPSYIELKRSEELDPFNAKHMCEIGHLKYYIENQLKQLTTYLEKEWTDHQENYRKEVKRKMAVPFLEEVYKTMHFQLKILHKQKTLIQELKEKLSTKEQKNKQSFLASTEISAPLENDKNRVSELSKLAENLLQLKINKEENSSHSGIMKSQLNAISERSKKLTKEKQTALRDALSECDTVRIRPIKSSLESSAFLRSLALEKMAAKASKAKSPAKSPLAKIIETPQTKPEAQPKPEVTKSEEKSSPKVEVLKTFSSGKPLTVQPLPEQEEKSPLASLSGIVSSIGKKNEVKTPTAFVFGSSNFQKSEPAKDVVAFGSLKLDQKQEEPKTTPMFTFGTTKPTEFVFGKKEPTVFGAKPVFGSTNLSLVKTTKPETTKTIPAPNVTITPITSAAATTASSPFTFTAATTTSTGLPKMNLLFSGKEQNSATPVSGSIFSVPSSTAQTSASSLIFSSELTFGNKITTSFGTSSTSIFGTPKTTSETSSGFTFTQALGNTTATNAIPVKATSETEDVDILKVDEPVKKPEISSEKSKDSPKVTVPSNISGSPSATPKTISEVTPTPSPPPSVTVASTTQTTAAITFVFTKPVTTTAAATTATSSTPSSDSVSSTTVTTTAAATTTATSSTFSFSTALTPTAFGQTATTTTPATTAASIFGTPTTTTSVFGSSITPTTNIFGGSTPATPTSNIFGGSTTAKPIFGQAATPTPTTSVENIFGSSTPTTLTQTTTPSTPTTFGQKSDSVLQTANLFGQMLSDGNRSVFGTPTVTTTTTANVFSTPKNFFGGGGSTTTSSASLFGTTSSSVFPQTTSIFGQSTTSPNVFGQSQTSTPSTFFGQNICSGFGGGASVTSNQNTFDSGSFSKPIFGQSSFRQTTISNSIFGGGSSSTIFGGTSSTTSSNVFQTPTTSTTFGSTSPGPFSGGTNNSFGENSFGSPSSTFQKPLGGFGSPPVFGGSPAFGGSPTFGSSASFGSLPTFGSMSQATFGQTAGSTTFENLANQNTVGFGNLAQQVQGQGFGGGFGSPSFENKSAFGGNSFSSWRSK